MEDVKLMLPEELACIGIETGNLLLFGNILACSTDSVDSVAKHDRGRAANEIGAPQLVLAAYALTMPFLLKLILVCS